MANRTAAGYPGKSGINNGRETYSCSSDGSFYSPFSFSLDDMEHLILINFEKDPDKYYNTFELQQACDSSDRKRLLVIAYRNDGGADIYHQPDYPFASQAIILNDVSIISAPLEGARFIVNDGRLDVFFAFGDKYGREIKVRIHEEKKPRRKPFFLLAPIGTVAREPKSFPVYSLYEMAFAKQKHTLIEIEIDSRRHKPDTFPLPLDCSKNYFCRFSADTFNVDWNKNFHGQLLPHSPEENNITEVSNTVYELVNNGGHHEIKGMSARNGKHQINIDFSPAVPDIACLRDGCETDGEFRITTDGAGGHVRGVYHVSSRGNEREIRLHPDKGWIPGEKRVILNILFLVVSVFKDWPKSYVWNANIKFGTTGHPVMKSGWERI